MKRHSMLGAAVLLLSQASWSADKPEVVSRNLKSADYKTTLPGAPDGKYVVVQFNTSFQNKKEAVETVVPMQETDGSWRVSGYFIK